MPLKALKPSLNKYSNAPKTRAQNLNFGPNGQFDESIGRNFLYSSANWNREYLFVYEQPSLNLVYLCFTIVSGSRKEKINLTVISKTIRYLYILYFSSTNRRICMHLGKLRIYHLY